MAHLWRCDGVAAALWRCDIVFVELARFDLCGVCGSVTAHLWRYGGLFVMVYLWRFTCDGREFISTDRLVSHGHVKVE